MIATVIEPFDPEEADFCEQSDDKFRLMKRMIQLLARWFASGAILILFASGPARSEDFFSWKPAGAGLAVSIVTHPGPVVYSTVRVELGRLNKDRLGFLQEVVRPSGDVGTFRLGPARTVLCASTVPRAVWPGLTAGL